MAPAQQQEVPGTGKKVVEQSRISPAPGSDVPETLPLTFFDYVFLPFHPVQRVFFYDLPCSLSDFLRSHLPHLKLSLSLALRDFRPLAGSLRLGSSGGKPEIRCSGSDAVAFTVAESGDDFHDVSGNHARDCARFYPLVPPLPPGTEGGPVLALQVTLFPNAGVALGITVSHAIADGSTSAHFLKTWAGICRLGTGGMAPCHVAAAPPSYDRSVVRDPKGLERTFLRDLKLMQVDRRLDALDLHGRNDVVLATFVLSWEQLKKMGERLSSRTGMECSPYTVASGLIWSCLGAAGPPLPATYFGNCLGICRVEAEGRDLEGEDGAYIASMAIWKVIRGLEGGGAFRGAEDWIRDIHSLASTGILTVAGSPKLGLYQVDFGWGRPRKIEVISIERTSAMSIAEWGKDGRGFEIGLALPRELMRGFSALLADRLKLFRSS
ncbi:unnamed protein product [Spirodela intermedia]|uniref:Uncharacterized protein n=1 Tax=Spirodela intermedia TaxID=51605 RepID=A0A7I8IF61_SPIIN|nr:unnamed protein product [Spirodela intermedia]CAA6655502.1 unnamed protein product [Spirodela intermedia]